MKKIISIMLSLALIISSITISDVVNVEASDQWKANAVTVPAEGELVGAGYIPVEFDNSMEGYTYTVYLDGEPMYWNGDDILRPELGESTTGGTVKTFTSSDLGQTEVYTNEVSKHELVVKAVKDGEEIVSDTRSFYVSKKGMALGGDMSDKISLSKLNCSWYYNWATDPFNNSIDAGVDHIPMMWGGADDNKEAMATFSTTANYILGFNEPDIGGQANMNVWDGIDVWEEYISPLNLRKISPAPAAPGGNSAWLEYFMEGVYICKNNFLNDGSWGLFKDYGDEASKTWVPGKGDDVDSVVLHYYRNQIDLQGLKDAVVTLWNRYHKPIWITEISIFGKKGTYTDYSYEIPEKRAEMAEYVQGLVEYLDETPYVERYCWFSYDIQSSNEIDGYDGSGATSMFDYASGNYTDLGRLYSNIGNPAGYNAEVITDDEMYVYVPPVEPTTEETTTEKTTEGPTTQKPTTVEPTTATKKVPTRVSIKTAKNIKKKSVKLTWKRAKNAKKYQVQYSLSSKFKTAKKFKTKMKTTSKLTYTVKSLTKKKIYYFRVRGVNGKFTGKWSRSKKIKIRK